MQQSMQKIIRTRVAPSPTGFPHLGLIYQAMFDYVLAHTSNGKFILRIEDTDRTRFVTGAEDVIYQALAWVHLLPDEGPKEGGNFGPYRQSERLPVYKKYAEKLLESKHAYRCFCTKERLDEMRKEQEAKHLPPMYDRLCRKLTEKEIDEKLQANTPFTIRMKMPDNKVILVKDALVGDVTFDSNQLDDQVLLKSDGFPTYHLAVVVDDYEMRITHVIRGTEWLPSFPKHVLLWQFLGLEENMPVFIHIPVLLNSVGGGKLSKRHSHTSVTFYQEEGFLPEAVVNYLANIVWNHPEGKEIFPIMDFGKALDAKTNKFAIKPNGVHFDLQKLTWMNGEYIREMTDADLEKRLRDFYAKDEEVLRVLDTKETAQKIIILAKTRLKTLKEFRELVIPAKVQLSDEEKAVAKGLVHAFAKITDWNKDTILAAMREVLQTQKVKGSVLYKIMTGYEHGLPLPETLEILGKEKTVGRLQS